jgi:hypothetical protein
MKYILLLPPASKQYLVYLTDLKIAMFTTYYLLPITYYLLPTTYYLLPTTYYLLPTTYYLFYAA